MKAGGESRMPITAWAVTDLPEPDSPRMASVSPSWTSKETPLIAFATPPRVRNATCRSSTSSSRPSCGCQRGCPAGSRRSAVVAEGTGTRFSAELGVEGVPDRVAQHDEGEHGQGQEDAGEQQHVRGDPDQADRRGVGD